MSALQQQQLLELGQRELVAAWRARCAVTDPDGAEFGLSWLDHGPTSALLAPRVTGSEFPISRVFDFRADTLATTHPILERLRTDDLDAVVEVLPGAHQADTETLLCTWGYAKAWQIAWYYQALDAARGAEHQAERQRRSALLAPGAILTRANLAPDLAELAGLLASAQGGDTTSPALNALAARGYQAEGFVCWLVRHDAKPVAGAVLRTNGSAALVDGAGTLPQHRGSGLQRLLLHTRLGFAAEQGALHGFSRTGAGSASSRNLERVGMRCLLESSAWRLIAAPKP